MSDMEQVRDIIAGGIRNYCTGHYCEPGGDDLDQPTMQKVYDDAESIADYIIGDGLRAAGYALVRVPDIAFKGPHDTNGTMLITAAEKAESARYPVGGSNVGRAVAQVLREVAAAAD